MHFFRARSHKLSHRIGNSTLRGISNLSQTKDSVSCTPSSDTDDWQFRDPPIESLGYDHCLLH